MTEEERANFAQDIAVRVMALHQPLTEDEQRWVRMAIQREAERAALRKAIIEKTFAGLAWSGIVALGLIFMDFLRAHGWKN